MRNISTDDGRLMATAAAVSAAIYLIALAAALTDEIARL